MMPVKALAPPVTVTVPFKSSRAASTPGVESKSFAVFAGIWLLKRNQIY